MDLTDYRFRRLREDGDLVLYRGRHFAQDTSILLAAPASRKVEPEIQRRLEHELSLADMLDTECAVRPREMVRYEGCAALMYDDPGGDPLESMVGTPLDTVKMLDIAIATAKCVAQHHEDGLIHKDIKPAHILITEDGQVRLTGFGLSTKLPRERQSPAPPDEIAGTLAYMSPEQSGRTNRAVDTRSDLYSLGVTLFEMATGHLPFAAADPMEWIYCHVARPPPLPSSFVPDIPGPLEAVILKLLSKSAEDRYQTATGLAHDLQICREAMRSGGPVPEFQLGQYDQPDRLLISEKLYGRDAEIARLVQLYDRVSQRKTFEFALVAGYSGVGKSSVVQELSQSVLATGGLFAAGKFDQHNRNIPYATLAEAFRGLIRWVMSQSASQFEQWKTALLASVGTSGQLLIDVIPELSLIFGEQQPPQSLLAEDEKSRFYFLFGRFIRVFARPEHPLVLFLDDLQWLDPATLELFERLVIDGGVPNLLLVGAYRSNEVDAAHGLSVTIENLRRVGTQLCEINLQPLILPDMVQLVADTLHADPASVETLTTLVFQKTEGNPFFVAQFLTALHDGGLLFFDADARAWRWDMARISAKGISSNVAELMAARLARHEGAGLAAIKYLASIGGKVETSTLGKLMDLLDDEVDNLLREFVGLDLVHRSNGRYFFVHDRVQEAAYHLISPSEREFTHLSIGRQLAERADRDSLEDEIFEIVTQYNRGSNRIDCAHERLRLAELNLIAGNRAKAAAAFQAAFDFFSAGCEMLPEGSWSTHYALTFELEFHRADCQMIIGQVEEAAGRFMLLSDRSGSLSDLARIVTRQVIIYTYLGRVDRALHLSLDCLSRMGVVLPAQPSNEQVAAEYQALISALNGRDIASLVDLPALADPHWLEVHELLVHLLGPAGVLEPDLLDLVILRISRISVERGISESSVQGFANIAGRIAGWRLGEYEDGNSFANLAMNLIEQRGFDRYASRAYAIVSGVVAPWNSPLRESYDIAKQAIEMPRERGGVTYSGYAWVCGLTAWLGSGKPLNEILRVAEIALDFAVQSKFSLVIEFITTQLMYVRAMQGGSGPFGDFSNGQVSEAEHLARLAAEPHFRHALTRHRVRNLQLKYHAGRYADCVAILNEVGGNLGESPVLDQSPVFEIAEYCFYSALARAAFLTDLQPSEWGRHFEAIEISCRQLDEWAMRCPANFSDRFALVAGEMARLQGDVLEAERRYEAAIRFAQENGMTQNEALANECAARFYLRRGFQTIGDAYLRNARSSYLRWGAHEKAAQLEEEFPDIGDFWSAHSTGLVRSDVQGQQLDLAAMVAMYQAVSGEIMMDRLIERLMETVVAYAGAARGLLFLDQGGQMNMVAEAIIDESGVRVELNHDPDVPVDLPRSILNYVLHSHDSVIIDDARDANRYSSDHYIRSARLRSILCLPLVKQRQLVGVLYLDNHLSSHVFTPDRLSILQLLASQAAISIQNAEYLRDVESAHEQTRRTEEELRAAFDMMPILAWRGSADGSVEFANKQWAEFTGHPIVKDDQEQWLSALHPDDAEKVSAKWRHHIQTGTPGEIEARMIRHDGEVRSFLIRATPMHDEAGAVVRWHGTNVDIETLKRAEQAQEAIARVSRITAMGELTVSIAHEVNQPLMAIVTNAATCLRWLESEPQNIEQARLAAQRIVRDGHRAGEVIASLRALAKKSSTKTALIDINAIVEEVLSLTENELVRHAIMVETDLATDGAWIVGDPVQMQQLLLNLILNAIEAINVSDHIPRRIDIASARNNQGYFEVAISDSGTGLDPERREEIFEVFFTTKKDGIGIGLSICRSIVEAHRGTIWTSGNEPHGMIVHFRIPAADEGVPA